MFLKAKPQFQNNFQVQVLDSFSGEKCEKDKKE